MALVIYLWQRSLRLVLITTLANLVPVVLGIALFGLFSIPLDLGGAIVAAIAFGLVLDDSAHYVARYCELRRSGYDAGTAVLRTSRELSSVIALTTFVVVASFAILYLAELKIFSDFALLVSFAMIVALITDLYLLPAALARFDQRAYAIARSAIPR